MKNDVTQQLKEEYVFEYLSQFRSRNKLYKEIDCDYTTVETSEPIIYKGHTKCITGIHLTRTNIYSCSKDRSIIKWDREQIKKDFISLGKDLSHHQDEILTLAVSERHNILATAGEDWMIKLWDVRSL